MILCNKISLRGQKYFLLVGVIWNISVSTNRLKVGHHIEDDKVVKEVEESRDGPLQGAEEGRAGGTAQVSAGSSL